MNKTLSLELALGLFLCVLLSMLLSWRVGINDFSLHALYRNRLVRAYLGASNPQRREDPFTGFDPHDDEYDLSDLVPSAQRPMPYLIVNTALNLVRGRRLAWQQRKAASFFLTPLYCGYDFVAHAYKGETNSARLLKVPAVVGDLAPYGFRRSEDYGDGVSLGTAMAISGAAASPNMGYHTSAPLAFLMTIFNVRLGWWLGNPRHEKTWQRSNPGCGLHYLLCELLGFTDDDSRYVYLSDGGHFENLGVYELVRRRCRLIIACDVGEDCGMKFSDLGNAIEKCQADFGIPIKIDLKRLRRLPASRFSQWHCALGTIEYSSADPQATYSGLLLYIKSSLIDDEPANVCSYANANDGFPHQSTADQWFDESQFESYRALGEHMLAQVLEPAAEWGRQGDIEKFCQALEKRWPRPENPPSDKGCPADSSATPESG